MTTIAVKPRFLDTLHKALLVSRAFYIIDQYVADAITVIPKVKGNRLPVAQLPAENARVLPVECVVADGVPCALVVNL